MANIKYFSGEIELRHPHGLDNAKFSAMFGIKGIRSDSFQKLVGYAVDGSMFPVERKIEFKSNPSLHKCDTRCLNATGRTCECSCGGKNHGAGSFVCEAT